MPEQPEQMNLLPEGAEAPVPEAPIAVPEGAAPGGIAPEGGMPVEGGGDEGFDIDSLLSQIDSARMTPETAQAETQEDSSSQFANALEQARRKVSEREAFESQDAGAQRLQKLEQTVSKLLNRNSELERNSHRQNIHNTINQGIKQELSDLEIDVQGKAATGITRLISNSVLVAVAQAQAATGTHDVDHRSIQSTVKNYTKVITGVAKELSNREKAEERISSSGAQPTPYKLSKPLGQLSDEEFGDVVLANLRGMK